MYTEGSSNALSLVKFILLHPCTLFQRDGAYYSNIKSNKHVKVDSSDVTYSHCQQSCSNITTNDVFVPVLIKLLMRGVYVSATDVVFATDSPRSRCLQCDIVAHHPSSGAMFCIFICKYRYDLKHTWIHAKAVIRRLKMISSPNALINIIVIPMYTYDKTKRLIFNIRESRQSRHKSMSTC